MLLSNINASITGRGVLRVEICVEGWQLDCFDGWTDLAPSEPCPLRGEKLLGKVPHVPRVGKQSCKIASMYYQQRIWRITIIILYKYDAE